MNQILSKPDTATGDPKLTVEVRRIVKEFLEEVHGGPVLDKLAFGERWRFSKRHVDNLLREGLPHLKVGKRRVRIEVGPADAWMRERFGVQRRGRAKPKEATPSTQKPEAV